VTNQPLKQRPSVSSASVALASSLAVMVTFVSGCSSAEKSSSADPTSNFAQAELKPTNQKTYEAESTKPLRGTANQLNCPKYTVFYIDPSTQFFTPPVPLEDHADFVFCSEHPNLDEVRARLRKLKAVRSQADLDSARIKAVPRGQPGEAVTFCSSGELTYRGKQYRLDRRAYEPSLLAITEEGDRQRALAIEKEAEERGPASKPTRSR
jgi:hypothetical protein